MIRKFLSFSLLAVSSTSAATIWAESAVGVTNVDVIALADSGTVDNITTSIGLSRGLGGGIYDVNPDAGAQVRWAFSGLEGNPASIGADDYLTLNFSNSFKGAFGGGNGNVRPNVFNRRGVVHLVADDIYLEITITQWGRSSNVSSQASFAYTRTSGPIAASLADLTYSTTNGEVTITGCRKAATGELVVPDTIGGNPVTSIGNSGFEDCTSLTSITIPNSVTSIGNKAFKGTPAAITIRPNPQIAQLEAQLAQMTAERDARPTQVSYDAVVTERDARPTQTAYETAVTESRTAGRSDVTTTPASYNLTTTEFYNTVVAERDARFVDTDKDGITDVKEAELETDSAEETVFYLQGAYDSAVAASRLTGQGDVAAAPASYNLTTIESYNTIVAERDARPTQEQCDTNATEARLAGRNEVTTSPAAYQLISISTYNTAVADRDARPTQAAYDTVVTERDARPTQANYNTVVAERNARPTEEAYNALIAERDARPTIEEVKDARLGSLVLQQDVANQSVKIRFSIEETDDFKTWIKRDEVNEVTVPLEVGKRFYRFALEDE